MDHKRFDEIVKQLATTPSRRSLLKTSGIAALGAVSSLFGRNAEAAVVRGPGQICRKNADCDSNLCGPTDSTGRRKCQCQPNQAICANKCVDPNTAYQSDKNNCGACGTRCSGKNICCQGNCVAPQMACNGVCCTGTQVCYSNACCQPGTIETLCSGHCGETRSNGCGGTVTCPACCVPEAEETTCSGKCGPQTNNCDQPVECASCCVPGTSETICPGQCGTQPDGCLGTVDCGPCCTDTEGSCGSNGDCCSSVCVDGTCAAGAVINGQPCDDNADCQSDTCCSGTCVDPVSYQTDTDNCGDCGTICPGTNTECSTVVCVAGVCGVDNEASGTICVEVAYCDGEGNCVECTLDEQCASEKCEQDNLCCVADDDLTTCVGVCGQQTNNCGQSVECGTCCGETEGACESNSDCCSSICVNGSCASGPVDNGDACDDDDDCTSGACCEGRCVSASAYDADINNCGFCGNICSEAAGSECSTDICVDGSCDTSDLETGTICVSVGYCDGAGTCVECTSDEQCSTNRCEGDNLCCIADDESVTCAGQCGSQSDNCGQPVECGECCAAAEDSCDINEDCCSSVCVDSICLDGPVIDGQPCDEDDDCQSRQCCDSICVAENAYDDDPYNCGYCGHVCSEVPVAECGTNICVSGTCDIDPVGFGTPLANQTPGDCQENICDGSGGTTTENDDNDVPSLSSTACVIDICTAGSPDTTYAATNTPCSDNGGSYCDGNGTCVECTTGTQCSSGVCTANVCCVENSDIVTCGSLCGQQTNNCGKTVACTPCCTPEDKSVTCSGKCGSQSNNCSQSVDCGICCGTGKRKSALGDYCVPDAAACALFAAGPFTASKDFTECDFSNKTIVSGGSTSSNFTRANFTGAVLTSVSFPSSNLTGANFTGAKLTSMDFRFGNLTNANFTSTNFICCNAWSTTGTPTTCPDGVGVNSGSCCSHLNGNTAAVCV